MSAKPERCSFCRATRESVNLLIAAPDGHAICDECVRRAAPMAADDEPAEEPAELDPGAPVISFVEARALILKKRGEL